MWWLGLGRGNAPENGKLERKERKKKGGAGGEGLGPISQSVSQLHPGYVYMYIYI